MPKVKGQKSSKVMLSKKEAKAVRGLIKGETKQTAIMPVENGDTRSSCMAVRTDGNTSGAGLLVTDNDSARILHTELNFEYMLKPLGVTTGANLEAQQPVRIRRRVVWWYKYSMSGSDLPAIEDQDTGLTDDEMINLPLDDSANAGKFVVLSDRVFNLGVNQYSTGTGANTSYQSGPNYIHSQEKVIVNKTTHFLGIPTSTDPGGESGVVGSGTVTRGLLVCYHTIPGSQASGTTRGGVLTYQGSMRTTYVA